MRETDQLAVLRQMRDEGRISDEEYEDLARGIDPADDLEQGVDEDADPQAETEPNSGYTGPTLRKDLTANYVGGLAIVALGLIVASAMGAVAWWVTIPAVLLAGTTLFKGLGKSTMIGAVVLAAVLVVGLAGNLDTSEPTTQTIAANLPPQDPYTPVEGSLDIYMDQIPEAWNTVDGPPQIIRGLTRHNETGEYDTFIYRWGEWGRLAGAYDPENDVLYALLVSGQLSSEATAQLYLPLCFMVAPYSQQCVDTYVEHGLDGGSLDDFSDVTHEAEWTLENQRWSIEIDQNVMTIRVFGADAA